jgi:hypothetical protein
MKIVKQMNGGDGENRKLALQLFVLVFLVSGIALLARIAPAAGTPTSIATSTQPAAVTSAQQPATSTAATSNAVSQPVADTEKGSEKKAQQSQDTASSTPEATRVEKPYTSDPVDFNLINTTARAALVNIFCTPHGGSLHPVSGSGVIIDPRGVILTNAHVAQYVLLSESPQVNLTCVIRTGSPATAKYRAAVLYVPQPWVAAHAHEINDDHPLGTGEHDYALLRIVGGVNSAALPAAFPAIEPDAREAIAFVDDSVLGASYPAEFSAGSVQNSLYPVSSITQINKLFTFGSGTVDAISIGSPIEAQSGSSGGPIVNAWERLVAIITTTSEGATTAERQLRGVTLSYIDRDLTALTGAGLSTLLAGDIDAKTASFTRNQAPGLVETYIPYLSR